MVSVKHEKWTYAYAVMFPRKVEYIEVTGKSSITEGIAMYICTRNYNINALNVYNDIILVVSDSVVIYDR